MNVKTDVCCICLFSFLFPDKFVYIATMYIINVAQKIEEITKKYKISVDNNIVLCNNQFIRTTLHKT